MKKFKGIIITAQIVFLLLFNYHVLHTKHGDNQTGVDMKFWGAMFLIIAAVIFLGSKFQVGLKGKTDKSTLIITSIFILVSANFFLFDYFNIMVEYETWFGRGMPPKPFWF
jgi:hypothetical protein